MYLEDNSWIKKIAMKAGCGTVIFRAKFGRLDSFFLDWGFGGGGIVIADWYHSFLRSFPLVLVKGRRWRATQRGQNSTQLSPIRPDSLHLFTAQNPQPNPILRAQMRSSLDTSFLPLIPKRLVLSGKTTCMTKAGQGYVDAMPRADPSHTSPSGAETGWRLGTESAGFRPRSQTIIFWILGRGYVRTLSLLRFKKPCSGSSAEKKPHNGRAELKEPTQKEWTRRKIGDHSSFWG